MTYTELPVLPPLRLEPVHPDVSTPVTIAALLADPVRAGIMALLRDGPRCVCELAAALEERQNNISNHLARLRHAGCLVQATRPMGDARRAYYERDEGACAAALSDLATLLRPCRCRPVPLGCVHVREGVLDEEESKSSALAATTAISSRRPRRRP